MAVSLIFSVVTGLFLVAMALAYAFATHYKTGSSIAAFSMFQDVHLMIFLGMGALMAFLKKASFTALGHTLFVGAVTILFAVLMNGFFYRVIWDNRFDWTAIPIDLSDFMSADMCVLAVFISLGAVMGRLSASQMFVMAMIETVLYYALVHFESRHINASDIGGSITIHLFGALFGLGVAAVANRRAAAQVEAIKGPAGQDEASNSFAMVGTLLMWCVFPTLNLLGVSSTGSIQTRSVTNTILALCSSVVATYGMCVIVHRGYFRMAEVQRSTLAGGIAMGACSAMMVQPYGAIIIGSLAGVFSVLGSRFLTPLLAKAGIIDTMGVVATFGLPGLIGGICSIVLASLTADDYTASEFSSIFQERSTNRRDATQQALFQLVAIAAVILFGLVGGLLTGLGLLAMTPLDRFNDDDAEFLFPEDVVVSEEEMQATTEPVAEA